MKGGKGKGTQNGRKQEASRSTIPGGGATTGPHTTTADTTADPLSGPMKEFNTVL